MEEEKRMKEFRKEMKDRERIKERPAAEMRRTFFKLRV